MKPGSPTKPPVRRAKEGELKELLGDGVLMFTVAKPRASSASASEEHVDKSEQLPAQPEADPTSSAG